MLEKLRSGSKNCHYLISTDCYSRVVHILIEMKGGYVVINDILYVV